MAAKRPKNITDEGWEILQAWDNAEDAYAKAIEDSETGMRYLNNDPYTPDEKADAAKFKKPLLRYNIIQQLFGTLLGNEQQFRRRARVRAYRGGKEAAVANIIQGRWNAINDEQDVEEKLDAVMIDALALKMGGVIERKFKMTEDGYLDFHYDIKNSMRLRYDPDTLNSDYKLEKCGWVIKEDWLTMDQLIEDFGNRPDFSEERKQSWYEQFTTFYKRFTNSEYSNQSNYDRETDKYRVLEMQKRYAKRMITVSDAEGKIFKVTPEEYRGSDYQKINDGYVEKIKITTVIPFFDWLTVMNEDAKWRSSNFDVFPMWSFGYNTQVIEGTSLMDLLLDIQDDMNKSMSQNRDYITQHLNGMLATSNREKEANELIDRKGNQPGQRIGLRDLKNNMPKRIAPDNIDPALMNTSASSMTFAREVSAVTEGFQGSGGKSGESAALFEKKLAQAAAAINPYFKSRSKLRKALMQDFVDNFGWVYSELDRIVSIKATPSSPFDEAIINLSVAGQIINDVSNPSMIVEIDEGEDNTLQKEDNFNQLLALANIVATVDPSLVPVQQLVASAPIEGTDEWLGYIEMRMKQKMADEAAQREIGKQSAITEQAKAEGAQA